MMTDSFHYMYKRVIFGPVWSIWPLTLVGWILVVCLYIIYHQHYCSWVDECLAAEVLECQVLSGTQLNQAP